MPPPSAIKLHTLRDLRGSIPTFIHISEGKVHDVNILDELLPEVFVAAGSISAERRQGTALG